MAAPGLDEEELRSLLSLYRVGELEQVSGQPTRSPFGTMVHVRAGGVRYLLRLVSGRRFSEMLFEKRVLTFLEQRAWMVPRAVPNVASGTFTPWQARGRFATLFEELPGRVVGLFEIRESHVREVGEALARLHLESELFGESSPGDAVSEKVAALSDRMDAGLVRGKIPRGLTRDAEILAEELRSHRGAGPLGPRGLIHGALDPSAARFRRGRLVALSQFLQSSIDVLTWDIAVTLLHWCWEPAAASDSGPGGRLHPERVRAFLAAYERERPLPPGGRGELAVDLRRAASAIAADRFLRSGIRRRAGQPFEDYRHFLARLEALDGVAI